MKKKIRIRLDTKIYPLEAVFYAIHPLLDQAYFYLDFDKNKKLAVTIIKKKGGSGEQAIKKFIDKLMNELIYAAARVSTSRNNKAIREYIVAKSLYSNNRGLTDDLLPGISEGLGIDQNDPLGIAVPWEEKYKKNAAPKAS